MWQTYDLPENVEITTLEEMMARKIDYNGVVMIRGVRDDRDFEYEKKVIMGNYQELGIDKYLVMVSSPEMKGISSSRAREMAAFGKEEELADMVSEKVARLLIERVRCAKREER